MTAGSESHSQKHSNSTAPVAQGTCGGKRGGGGIMASSDCLRTSRHSAKGVVRGRGIAAAVSASVLVVLVAALALLPSRQQGPEAFPSSHSLAAAASGGVDDAWGDEVQLSGIAASSSMWGVAEPVADGTAEPRYRRELLFMGKNLRAGGPAPARKGQPAAKRPPGEPAMLNDFAKAPVDNLDLDDVQEGHLWIPVAVNGFDGTTTDPLVKMCQVNYAKYSAAPWLLPMGGLLSLNSGCAVTAKETVQILRLSVLERILAKGPVKIQEPTGFIFHETRCGSTLVANMLASVETNVMWSESTGPWKLMHTCSKCAKSQIVPWLKVIMNAMSRSARHNHFYFKFQSSEDIEAVTAAFPEVPWIFIFREPIEVMMSRLGAQRIGMEGMEKEVLERVEKGMAPMVTKPRTNQKGANREVTTAQQLSGLCKKAIAAFEARPGMGMMVEYPHLPDGIVETVLPRHFHVDVSDFEHERMMNTTKMYSKVASFGKGAADSKFTEDTGTKHDAASPAVTEAAQRYLYPDFYQLKGMQTWQKVPSG